MPLRLEEPLGSQLQQGKSFFDDKLTTSDEYRFNGVKGGFAWKGKTERHFISRCFIFKGILEWAEQEELETISPQRFIEAVGSALTREQVHLINAAIWGFLSGSVYGVAEEIFKRADTLNGG